MASSVEGRSLVSSLKEALKSRNGREEDLVESVASADHVQFSDTRPPVLLTNENGIHSPGLQALVQALLRDGSFDIYVCAPQCEFSEVGHSITTQKTLEASQVDMKGVTSYEVSGTPADCVSLSLSGVLFPRRPIFVLCGLNKGSNCGYHTFSSGTVGAAREAFICGVPSFALSLDWKKGKSHDKDFSAAAELCLPLIRTSIMDAQHGSFPPGFFLNINIPTPFLQHKGFRITKRGTSRREINWQACSQKGVFGMGLCKENAIGIRVAQLGLAASAVGAARRANSSIKNIEVESIAGPANGSHDSITKKKYYYEMEFAEVMTEDADNTIDSGALHDGFVSVTPLGSINDSDVDLLRRVADWMASFLEFESPIVS